MSGLDSGSPLSLSPVVRRGCLIFAALRLISRQEGVEAGKG